MIEYKVDNAMYGFSYKDTKESYEKYCAMSDKEFMENIAGALHLACFICYIKEVPSYVCLCDKGIIHELAHMVHIPKENTTPLKEIRRLFKIILKLS